MREVVIVSAVRTPVGSYNGSLASFSASDLGAIAIKAAVDRAGIKPRAVDEVIFGNVLQAGQGQNPARQAAVKAGLPIDVPAWTLNKVCGSGLKTVNVAAQAIMCGDADIIVAGGMESMSQAPYTLEKARWGYRMGNDKIVDVMIKDGLWCAFNDYHMGITAENVARLFNVSREEQDQFAFESQQKAVKAIQTGAFKDEIVPVTVKTKKGEVIFENDEYPKPDASLAGIKALKPAFKRDGGTVTAANASGINDGAAAFVVMAADKAKEAGLKPLARIAGYSEAAIDPSIMGVAPIAAVKKVFAKTGLTAGDIDLVEANEAFAAQAVAVCRDLGFPKEKVNVNGGAIAIGHPIGASGARILVTLLYAMKKRGAKCGLATLCIGGGQSVVTILESL